MSPAVAPRLVVCLEYQRLLNSCQKSLVAWQQHSAIVRTDAFKGQRVREQLVQLQNEYARAYALLESHEQHCQHCQYIAKVGGMDFESMANALDRRHRFS